MINSINSSPGSNNLESNNLKTDQLRGKDSNQVSSKSTSPSEPSSWFSKFPDLSACASSIGRFTSSCLKSLGSTISWPFYQCAAAVSRFISRMAQSDSDMTKNAEKLFNKGIIKTASTDNVSKQYKRRDEESTGPAQTETVLTTEMKNTAEMEMMIDDLHLERSIPSACAQFYGAEDRGKLLEQALYKPSACKEYLEQRLVVIEEEIGKYTELASQLNSLNGLSTETRLALATTKNQLSEEIELYKSQFTDLEKLLKDPSLAQADRPAINDTLKLLTIQLEEAETKHNALLPYSKTDEELSSQASDSSGTPLILDELKEVITAKQTALIEKKTSFQNYNTWLPYRLAAVTEADSFIISKRGSLLSTQTNLRETKEKLTALQKELQNAQNELEQLQKRSSEPIVSYVSLKDAIPKQVEKDAKIGELRGKISNLQKQIAQLEEKIPGLSQNEEDLRNDLNQIQTELQSLIKKAEGEEWSQPSCQAIVNFVNKNNPESIQFDRIRVKVNGQILPLTGSQSEENLQIFKEALQKLALTKTPPLEISDDQIKEMITLCSCEKTAQGTPAGSASAGDGLPSFGVATPLIPGDIDCYEIVIPDDSPTSIDFQFHSGRALLSKIQFQAGYDQVDQQLISFRHNNGGSFENSNIPNDFQQFERSCSFTYRYTPKISSNVQNINMEYGNLELIKSQQAYWPIRLMPANIQIKFVEKLNAPERDTPNLTANTVYKWDPDKGKDNPPDISEQFYIDINRTNYFVQSEDGQPKPLYDRSTGTDDENQLESMKRTAIKEFSQFVGDNAKALAISKIANQQVAFAPLRELLSTNSDSPLQLKNHGVGQPLGGFNDSYTFSKSPKGDVVIGMKIEQKPSMFVTNSLTEPKFIELDDKKSLVTFDYDLTCHFDNDGKLSITSGPINYTCQLAENALH
ncbi:MAG: hypothetical protein K9M81_01535 [Chthoniobacterales bacterium]|nr:hypothetical protein [Chthoniobacterales bacterium]